MKKEVIKLERQLVLNIIDFLDRYKTMVSRLAPKHDSSDVESMIEELEEELRW